MPLEEGGEQFVRINLPHVRAGRQKKAQPVRRAAAALAALTHYMGILMKVRSFHRATTSSLRTIRVLHNYQQKTYS